MQPTSITPAASGGQLSLPTSPIAASSGRFLSLVDTEEVAGSSFASLGRIQDDELDHELFKLADQWMKETAVLSSITEKALHPAYQQIIGVGPKAVPFLLRQLRDRRGHWFWALKSITRQDPVPPEARGRIPEMTQAWLEWGKRRELI